MSTVSGSTASTGSTDMQKTIAEMQNQANQTMALNNKMTALNAQMQRNNQICTIRTSLAQTETDLVNKICDSAKKNSGKMAQA